MGHWGWLTVWWLPKKTGLKIIMQEKNITIYIEQMWARLIGDHFVIY